MAKRWMILLVALLALGFVVSGCGDDDDDDKATETVTTQETAPAATTEEKPDAGGGSAASGVPDTPQAKQAIETCKKQASASPQISAEAKKKLAEVCEQAGSGDADGAVKASREACKIIAKESTPEGPGRQTAIDACEQSTKTP